MAVGELISMVKDAVKKRTRFEDILALIIIVACFYLILKGIDHTIGAVLLAVTSYYFGHKRQ